jgi:hypothetical protein
LTTTIYEFKDNNFFPLSGSEVELSDNAACLDAPYTFEVSKAEASQKNLPDMSSDASIAGVAASCGSTGPPNNGPGSSMSLLVIGFLLGHIASTLTKGCKKFLS